MIILHNPHDKASRDFVEQYGAGHTVLEYPDCAKQYPAISAFPSIIYYSEDSSEYRICRQPETWGEVEQWVPTAFLQLPKTPEQIQQELTEAVQNHLDTEARKLGYDDIKSAVTYADEPVVPKFQAEGQAFRVWRSLVWAYCYQALAEALAGTRAVPTAEELIAELQTHVPLILPE